MSLSAQFQAAGLNGVDVLSYEQALAGPGMGAGAAGYSERLFGSTDFDSIMDIVSQGMSGGGRTAPLSGQTQETGPTVRLSAAQARDVNAALNIKDTAPVLNSWSATVAGQKWDAKTVADTNRSHTAQLDKAKAVMTDIREQVNSQQSQEPTAGGASTGSAAGSVIKAVAAQVIPGAGLMGGLGSFATHTISGGDPGLFADAKGKESGYAPSTAYNTATGATAGSSPVMDNMNASMSAGPGFGAAPGAGGPDIGSRATLTEQSLEDMKVLFKGKSLEQVQAQLDQTDYRVMKSDIAEQARRTNLQVNADTIEAAANRGALQVSGPAIRVDATRV